MEMHQLRYVVAVAEEGNFSHAAERCNVSQPTLSQQIKKLEDELDARLFDRTTRRFQLTAIGETFLSRAVHILEEADHAMREAHNSRSLLRGPLLVGILPTIAPFILSEAIAIFTENFPNVQITVTESTTGMLAKLLNAYELDLAIASVPFGGEEFDQKKLLHDELLLALPPHHKLAKRNTISLDHLDSEKLIVMKEGHCLGDQVLQFCDKGGMCPQISFRSSQLDTVLSLDHAGLGVSLIPWLATLNPSIQSPVFRPFIPPHPFREILAYWPKRRPPSRAANEFLSILTNNIDQLEGNAPR